MIVGARGDWLQVETVSLCEQSKTEKTEKYDEWWLIVEMCHINDHLEH